jgi:hypothetical protein
MIFRYKKNRLPMYYKRCSQVGLKTAVSNDLIFSIQRTGLVCIPEGHASLQQFTTVGSAAGTWKQNETYHSHPLRRGQYVPIAGTLNLQQPLRFLIDGLTDMPDILFRVSPLHEER